jgi:hypothetical protein
LRLRHGWRQRRITYPHWRLLVDGFACVRCAGMQLYYRERMPFQRRSRGLVAGGTGVN